MSIHFVEYKDFTDLDRKFTVPFGSQNVLVFIWKSRKGLERNTNFNPPYFAAYVPYPYRKRRGLFGEIHLIMTRVDNLHVSHEIQHFIFDWAHMQPRNASLEERQAALAGQVTRDFWKIYESK